MQITARDLAILVNLHRLGFASSPDLVALDRGNKPNVLARLRKLFDHGFVERPLAQLVTMPLHGPQPMVYALSTAGARLLRQFGQDIEPAADLTERAKRAGPVYLQHSVAISSFMVTLEVHCRKTHGVELIHEHQMLAEAPAATRSAREPLRWIVEQTPAGQRESCSVVADGAFGLRFADNTGTFFLLEMDRGTIPITRRNASRHSIYRKLEVYWHGWLAGRHREQFGRDNLRVAFVTTSPERVQHMVGALDAITHGKGSGFFLFADGPALAAHGPLALEWLNGKRQRVRLTD
jgi:hypothetical protein